MKTTQIRAEEGRSTRRDPCESRPAGGNQQTMANIDDVLRQIIREELAALQFTKRDAPEEDQLLTASEAAKLLHVSERWLYKHASTLPYAVRLSETVVRFSRNKIQAEIQRKLKMQT
jgi:predicted DNA-binding transcriptional regulator AlpA